MKTLMMIVISIFSLSAQAQSVNEVVSKIEVLTEKKDSGEYTKVAVAVMKYSKKHNVDYKLVLALFMTESTFNQDAVSKTGDLGIGQINPKVWTKEFTRLKMKPLDIQRLKTDVDYAVARTVEILAHLKCKKDPFWIGKYHSKTPSLKKAYFARIKNQLDKMAPVYVAFNN